MRAAESRTRRSFALGWTDLRLRHILLPQCARKPGADVSCGLKLATRTGVMGVALDPVAPACASGLLFAIPCISLQLHLAKFGEVLVVGMW